MLALVMDRSDFEPFGQALAALNPVLASSLQITEYGALGTSDGAPTGTYVFFGTAAAQGLRRKLISELARQLRGAGCKVVNAPEGEAGYYPLTANSWSAGSVPAVLRLAHEGEMVESAPLESLAELEEAVREALIIGVPEHRIQILPAPTEGAEFRFACRLGPDGLQFGREEDRVGVATLFENRGVEFGRLDYFLSPGGISPWRWDDGPCAMLRPPLQDGEVLLHGLRRLLAESSSGGKARINLDWNHLLAPPN